MTVILQSKVLGNLIGLEDVQNFWMDSHHFHLQFTNGLPRTFSRKHLNLHKILDDKETPTK